jgi:hypothetical protein
VKTLYPIAAGFNNNTPSSGASVKTGKQFEPGICFGASTVWCKAAANLSPTKASTSDTVFSGTLFKCRNLQFAYEQWGAADGLKDEKRTLQALESEGLATTTSGPGAAIDVEFGGDLNTLADKLFGEDGNDGVFMFKLGGPVLPSGRGAHWMGFRRATKGATILRLEFFDVNRVCYVNLPNDTLAGAAAELAGYLNHYYNGQGGGPERFAEYCLLYPIYKKKAVKIGW